MGKKSQKSVLWVTWGQIALVVTIFFAATGLFRLTEQDPVIAGFLAAFVLFGIALIAEASKFPKTDGGLAALFTAFAAYFGGYLVYDPFWLFFFSTAFSSYMAVIYAARTWQAAKTERESRVIRLSYLAEAGIIFLFLAKVGMG